MPNFPARRRAIAIETVKVLYAVPILSPSGRRLRWTIYFHPRDDFTLSLGAPSTILSESAATDLGLKVGNDLQMTLCHPTNGDQHVIDVVVGKIVPNYPRRFIWVAASELKKEFSFSDDNPTHFQQEITLHALDAAKCFNQAGAAVGIAQRQP